MEKFFCHFLRFLQFEVSTCGNQSRIHSSKAAHKRMNTKKHELKQSFFFFGVGKTNASYFHFCNVLRIPIHLERFLFPPPFIHLLPPNKIAYQHTRNHRNHWQKLQNNRMDMLDYCQKDIYQKKKTK